MAKRRSSQFNTPGSTHASARAARLQPASAAKVVGPEHSAPQQSVGEDLGQGDLPVSELKSAELPVGDGPASDVSASELPASELPARGLRGLLSLAIILQGFSLLLALSSNLAPSYLQGRILGVVGPYLHATHQYYHALPLELTRAEPLDWPLTVELQVETTGGEADRSAGTWQPLALSGLFNNARAQAGVSDTRWHNLGRWLALTASADADSEILSDFAARAIQLAERQSGQRYQAVRFSTAKVLSYDEDLALAGNLREPGDEIFQPNVIYSASVVRLDDLGSPKGAGSQRLSLVPAQDALRTAKPVGLSKELP